MSQETQQADIAKKTIVFRIPGMEDVIVRRDVEYQRAEGDIQTMDIYYPRGLKAGAKTSAVVFVTGYPDAGFQKMLGCKQKEMGSYISWGRLLAASGLAAIAYTNKKPAADAQTVLRYVRQNAASLGIDENRIGVWACSGNVPLSLSLVMPEGRDFLKCAVLLYGYMLDLDGSTFVADASRQWGFVNPASGKSVGDLPQDMPFFIVRAGQDQTPHLNETIDLFLAKATALNLPLTFVNHAAAPHAFDLWHDSETSREIIRQILAFMRFHLAFQDGAVPAR